ncbi:hypothetical protein A1O3_05676 [Capronia epimyces CBS 606.96]|uniref:Uncharacterized protein n=1 Tax=Capronia epimyces CBS 606.96 TaxID=1182542 RepID=W9Y6Z1_9EURO|nr:uncharacterized protein A1O3_05676 [Capronia epimyces CBS 606.96]EXJ85001.1 hypothetical protein A1O3_05676 [Capronia epimyces CBS 606.96]
MSSAEEPVADSAMADQPNLSEQPAASRKSYRRKYRKSMVTFEEKMRENTSLFREEQRIMDISERLAEQNDQLLQLLLELNSCPQVPPSLRYDLRPPGNQISSDERSKLLVSEEEGHLELRKARSQLQAKEIDETRYREIEASLLKAPAFAPKRSYASLLSVAPPPRQPIEKMEPNKSDSSGFLSTKHEEDYLQALDAFLDGANTNPRSHAVNSLGSRNAERTTERERETQLKNPVSVYNWLRKHQPQVFLQDNETSSEKPSRATGSRISARKSANKEALKQEPDLYDDDGIALDPGSSLRGKRKRDADGGYRPKGGNSKGTKRRKEPKEDTGRSKRSKKSALDAR